jgi:phenylacetate-coenzyme A ligase PaaK-like adenylate-forming protein
MPFLRYRIGDLAEFAEDACSCRRSLSVLKSILGRTGDVFKTKDGRLIEPGFWCHAFMVGRQSQDVEKFQVVIGAMTGSFFESSPKPAIQGRPNRSCEV